MDQDEKWMKFAVEEAIQAKNKGEVPVGAIIIQDNIIISKAHNQSIIENDATAHAEIQAIRLAGNVLKNYRMNNASMYVTLEPCPMCLGAIMHARLERVVFGAYDSKSGACGTCENLMQSKCFNHSISIKSGVLEKECSKLLRDFFQLLR
jgi:tRNA(adenine34) deaminase